MKPEERYQRIDAIFDRALELTGAERDRYLDEACDTDRDLRKDVEALLASHEQAGGFLSTPALEAAARNLARGTGPSLVGKTLGPYPIVALLGVGGMGEVYRAHDPRLGRDVAIKVLPSSLSADREALARFEREVRAVASLSHPNILAIHDVGVDQGIAYAVMELVDADTLRGRLVGDPLPWRKAVRIAVQIADGLAAAHTKGIVHRDLKPENISIGASGQAKILDFGLARVLPGGHLLPGAVASATEPGTLMGTVGYMSPEQVRGEDAGPASDIFAFGCLIYEMLSGRAPFARSTVAEGLASVLRDDPAPLAPARDVPPALEAIVLRCLEKLAPDRFQSASDLAFALRATAGSASGTTTSIAAPEATSHRHRSLIVVGAALGLLLGAAGATIALRPTATPPVIAHLSLSLAEGLAMAPNDSPGAGSSLAVSSDGRWVTYVVRRGGERQLALRALDQPEATIVAGTEDARSPVFSPDAKWIAFFTETDLRKVPITGGTPTVICPMPPVARGAAWGDDGMIYYSPSFSDGLFRVPAGGGKPTVVTKIDASAGESNHLLPDVLPGAEALLFTVWKGGDFSAASIWSAALGSGERQLLIEGATAPRYVAPDVLVFARGGGLFAVRFDARRRAISGDAIPVVNRVWSDRTSGTAHYAVSETGTLVFAGGGEILERRRLAWVDRRGQMQPLEADPSYYANPRLSPDGRRIAVEALNDLWIYDTVDTTLSRVTFRGVNQHPVWSPDGRRLAFSSSQGVAAPTVFWAEIDAGELPEPIGRGGGVQFPASWTRSGNALAYARLDRAAPGAGWDLWLFHPGDAAPERQIVRTPFKDDQPILSPDGSALAYVSNETGKLEVYARAFPSLDRRFRISVDGGTEPVWSRTGREIFFRRGRQYFSVAIGRTGDVLSAGRPALMFEGDYLVGSLTPGFPSYDVTPDGQQFVVVERSADTPRIERLDVVIGWPHELARRLTPGAER